MPYSMGNRFYCFWLKPRASFGNKPLGFCHDLRPKFSQRHLLTLSYFLQLVPACIFWQEDKCLLPISLDLDHSQRNMIPSCWLQSKRSVEIRNLCDDYLILWRSSRSRKWAAYSLMAVAALLISLGFRWNLLLIAVLLIMPRLALANYKMAISFNHRLSFTHEFNLRLTKFWGVSCFRPDWPPP